MASFAALTWSSLQASYSAPAWQPRAALARASYAQQGQLLPAAGYLGLAPAVAAPFVGSAARQLVAPSLRDRFADQWYDLPHAAEPAPADRYQALLTPTPADLPLPLRNAQVSQVTVFVDAPLDEDSSGPGAFTDRSGLEVRLGGARTTSTASAAPAPARGWGCSTPATPPACCSCWAPPRPAPGPWPSARAACARLDAGRVNGLCLLLEVMGEAPA